MKNKLINEERGITLVALIITIIILVILASVTIGKVINDKLIELAIYSTNKYLEEADKENEETSKVDNELEKIYSKLQIADSNGSSLENVDMVTLKSLIQKAVPTGTVIAYYASNAPEGYLACDGTSYSLTEHPEYKDLAELLGQTGTTCTVPDLRGEFLRGTGTNGHTNQGDGAAVGVHQDNGLPNIAGSLDMYSSDAAGCFSEIKFGTGTATGNGGYKNGPVNFQASLSNPIYGNSNYVTPTNTSVLYCIKY